MYATNPQSFYARELSHVSVWSHNGEWLAEAVYMHGAGTVDLDVNFYDDTVFFSSHDRDAQDDANTCDEIQLNKSLILESRLELAHYIRRSRIQALTISEQRMMNR